MSSASRLTPPSDELPSSIIAATANLPIKDYAEKRRERWLRRGSVSQGTDKSGTPFSTATASDLDSRPNTRGTSVTRDTLSTAASSLLSDADYYSEFEVTDDRERPSTAKQALQRITELKTALKQEQVEEAKKLADELSQEIKAARLVKNVNFSDKTDEQKNELRKEIIAAYSKAKNSSDPSYFSRDIISHPDREHEKELRMLQEFKPEIGTTVVTVDDKDSSDDERHAHSVFYEGLSIPLSPAPIVTTREERVQRAAAEKYINTLMDTKEDKNPNKFIADIVGQLIGLVGNSDKEAMMHIKYNLERIKMFFSEQSKQNMIQLQLMKGQLERRSKLLLDQRTDFLKELALLKEELFRLKQDPNYKPNDFILHQWYGDGKVREAKRIGEPPASKRKKQKVTEVFRKEGERSEKEKLVYSNLKKQTEQVTETLQKLKELELKRREEIAALRKRQKETDLLKDQLKREKDKHKYVMQRDEEERKKRLEEEEKERLRRRAEDEERRKNIVTLLMGTKGNMTEQEIALLQDLSKEVEQEKQRAAYEQGTGMADTLHQQDMASDRETGYQTVPSTADDKVPEGSDITDIEKFMESSGKLREQLDSAGSGDEESLLALESQITDFHSKFNTMVNQMNSIKKRLTVYEDQKTPINKDEEPGPEGFITLVFTDVQDSTRMWELDMDAMCEGIKIHNQIMREQLRKWRGYEVKTEGDAFMCTFGSVHDAVEFAINAQMALMDAPWPEEILALEPARIEFDENGVMVWRGLRVRMGMHCGTPIVEKDPVTGRADYFGPVVNRSARVEGQAAGGQIVFSSSVWKEIQGRVENNKYTYPIYHQLIGTVTLKGMDEPETVRWMIPEMLRKRKFKDSHAAPQSEQSSVNNLKEQLSVLETEHKKLDMERTLIQEKIQFRLKIQALEESMKEKDDVIDYLREKLNEIKESYGELIKDPSDTKGSPLDLNTKLQQDIDAVMTRYEEMKQQYDAMRANYDQVVKLFNKRLKSELEIFKEEIQKMNKNVVRKESEITIHRREWDAEKRDLSHQIEQKNKVIAQKDSKIRKLRKELVMSRITSNIPNVIHANPNNTGSPVAVKASLSETLSAIGSKAGKQFGANINIGTFNSPKSGGNNNNINNIGSFSSPMLRSISTPPPAITIGEITAMLKKIIQEAVQMQKNYAKFDWDTFLKAERQRRTSIKPEPTKKRMLKILDTATHTVIDVPEEDLRAWGISQLSALDPKLLSKLSQKRSPPKKSLMQTATEDITSETRPVSEPSAQATTKPETKKPEELKITMKAKKKPKMPIETEVEQFMRDALYVPQSSRTAGILPDIHTSPAVPVRNPKIKKWITLAVSSAGPIAKHLGVASTTEDVDVERAHFKYMSKTQKRQEMLKALYYDKNASRYSNIVENTEANNSNTMNNTISASDMVRTTPSPGLLEPGFVPFKYDEFAVFGIDSESPAESMFADAAQVRRLKGIKRDITITRSHSSFEKRKIINKRNYTLDKLPKRSKSSASDISSTLIQEGPRRSKSPPPSQFSDDEKHVLPGKQPEATFIANGEDDKPHSPADNKATPGKNASPKRAASKTKKPKAKSIHIHIPSQENTPSATKVVSMDDEMIEFK